MAIPRTLPFLLALVAMPASSRADSASVQVEAAVEFDSNVERLESGSNRTSTPAGALRFGARASASGRRAKGLYAATASATVREVLESTIADEDLAIVGGDARWLWPLRDPRVEVGVQLGGYDVVALGDLVPARAFRTLSAAGVVALGSDQGHRLAVSVGARDFHYKPDDDFDWRGPTVTTLLTVPIWTRADDTRQIDLAFEYRVEARSYAGLALQNLCPPIVPVESGCIAPTELSRHDLVQSASALATYTGPVVLSAGYTFTLNRSTSFGQALARHRLNASATVRLPRAVYLSATVTAQLDQYLDGLLVAAEIAGQSPQTLDDDNRSSLQLRFARALSARTTLELRAAAWRDLGGDAGSNSFRRSLITFGITYSR